MRDKANKAKQVDGYGIEKKALTEGLKAIQTTVRKVELEKEKRMTSDVSEDRQSRGEIGHLKDGCLKENIGEDVQTDDETEENKGITVENKSQITDGHKRIIICNTED